jgi:membrane associated rhomboid family serine protease
MGLYNRDYLREDSYSGDQGGWMSSAPVCRALVIITGVVFVLQVLFVQSTVIEVGAFQARAQQSIVDEWFRLEPAAVFQGQLWRVLTYCFLHARQDLLHILFNMLALWMFGSTLERMLGGREFLWFYLSAGMFAGLGFLVWGLILRQMNPVVGASGAVLAVMMLYAAHFPTQVIHLFGLIPIEMRWLVALYAAFDMLPVLAALGGAQTRSNVAHTAHLMGLLFGWLYYRQGWRLERFSSGITDWWTRQRAARRQIRVYREQESVEQLDAEVDRILQKIHEHGSESLSERERRLLTKASEQYKKRQ